MFVRGRQIIALVALFGAASFATAAKPQSLFPNATPDVAALLPPPPAPGSPEARADLAIVLQAQADRTPEEIARCKAEAGFGVFAFSDALSPAFTAQRYPKLAALFKLVRGHCEPIVDQAKAIYKRPRPPFVSTAVKPLLGNSDASYPSGHSTQASLDAMLLAELFPDHKKEILARGCQLGWDRVIAGVHFPSDVLAGRFVGRAIAEGLLADPDFQKQFAAVKAEIAANPLPDPAMSAAPAHVPSAAASASH